MSLKLVKYFYTLRYLKIQQILWRVWFILINPSPNTLPMPELQEISGIFSQPARRRISLVDANTFFFLGQKENLKNIGWDSPQITKLWRYNQHYFDDLNAKNAQERVIWHTNLLKRWVDENIPGIGSGWEPYPTSLRITNWVKWQCSGNLLPFECLQSLATQARWLRQHIEWHILGNHLFANAKALVFAGLFFKGKEAEEWLFSGLKIIKQELPEQVLSDGGNFERSPMYHAIFLEDLLDLINMSSAYSGYLTTTQVDVWRETAERMLGFFRGICHPDGEISFFNDAAIGIAPSQNELLTYAKRLGLSSFLTVDKAGVLGYRHFEDTGYVRVQAPFAVALLDVAPVGPDYLPGHAHADTLSFELSIFGHRVIVNGGTSEYGNGPIRFQERSTAAHSTVEIDYENSSEVWSGFRVARRAYPIDLKIHEDDQALSVHCAHNGYHRLFGQPTHRREWTFTKDKLMIEDQILGKFKNAIARFYLHPDIQIVTKGEGFFLLETGDHSVTFKVCRGRTKIEHGFYAPEFGHRLKTNCLLVDFGNDNSTVVEISWRVNH